MLATQNPVESESTFRLPAAQMDRFLIRISMGYGQGNAPPVNGDLPLFHGLQQGGLCAWNGPIDLIGQEQVGHDGALPHFKVPGFLIENLHSDDVAGQHVRHKLNAPGAASKGKGNGLHQRGLAHTWQVVQKHMAVGQHSHDNQADAV